MKLNRIALAVVLAATTAMPAHAALFSVTPLVGYHSPDEGDSSAYVGLAAGVKLVQSVAVEAEYGKASDFKLLSANVLVSPASWSSGAVSPYILGGFAQQDFDGDITKSGTKFKVESTDTMINLGAGAMYSLSDALSLRGELRAIHNSDQSLTDYLVLAGLQYGFGQAPSRPVYVAPPEPTNYTPADTDGDGVVDTNDRCPNTPAGWEVGVDGCPLDADKDRVPNSIDECPNTPAGMQVGANGCPLDEDKDGVTDAQDKCPGTAPNISVDDKGCAKVITQAIKEEIKIVFDSGKSIIKPEFKGEVAKIADLAKQYPTSVVAIEGHTDASGKAANNLALSKARANAVRAMLISDFGIAENRVTAQGFGSTQPIADNKTADGKAKNRRVVAVISGERKVVVTKPVKAVKAKKSKKGAGKKKAKK